MALETAIIGAIRGAVGQVVPGLVLQQMAEKISAAHRAPKSKPLPSSVLPSLDVGAIADAIVGRVQEDPTLQDAVEPKAWYQSTGVWGGLVATVAPMLTIFGINVSQATTTDMTQVVTGLVAAIGGIMAIIGRVKAQRPVKA